MKVEIRNQVLAKLERLDNDPKRKKQIEDNITTQLFQSELWQHAERIGVTLSMSKEFNTETIIQQAFREDKTVSIPKTYAKGIMKFYDYRKTDPLKESKFGVMEPLNKKETTKDEIDLMIVPGVAFNSEGYRIGFGGGFYDRYLEGFEGNTCSLVFQEQLVTQLTIEPHDLPVNQILMYHEGEQ